MSFGLVHWTGSGVVPPRGTLSNDLYYYYEVHARAETVGPPFKCGEQAGRRSAPRTRQVSFYFALVAARAGRYRYDGTAWGLGVVGMARALGGCPASWQPVFSPFPLEIAPICHKETRQPQPSSFSGGPACSRFLFCCPTVVDPAPSPYRTVIRAFTSHITPYSTRIANRLFQSPFLITSSLAFPTRSAIHSGPETAAGQPWIATPY